MPRTIKYPKIKKICSICNKEFETRLGNKYEKTFCSRGCANYSRIIPGKKERAKELSRKYRKEHPEWAKETSRRARIKLRNNEPERLIWMETKKRAKKRGIHFDIEVSDIVIPKRCPILNIELSLGKGRVHDGSPSLDRIIPEKGYVKNNCFIISSKANRMKQENTLESLEKIISYIKERLQ